MAPIKSIPFRIVTKHRTIQVGEKINFEENTARITAIKKIEFLPVIILQLLVYVGRLKHDYK